MECVTLRTQHVTRVERTSNSPGGARARYAFIRDPFCFPDMRDIRNQPEDLQSTLTSNFIDDSAVPHQRTLLRIDVFRSSEPRISIGWRRVDAAENVTWNKLTIR